MQEDGPLNILNTFSNSTNKSNFKSSKNEQKTDELNELKLEAIHKGPLKAKQKYNVLDPRITSASKATALNLKSPTAIPLKGPLKDKTSYYLKQFENYH